MAECVLLSAGDSFKSDECTAKTEHVLAGRTAITSDSDDDPAAGTMPNIAAIDPAKSIAHNGNSPDGILYFRMSPGAHITNATSGYPEVSCTDKEAIKAMGLTVRGQYQYGGATWCGTYFAVNALPEGIYRSNGASWAPEGRCTAEALRTALGITASKIKSGQSIAGVSGSVKEYAYYQADVATAGTDSFKNINGNTESRYVVEASGFNFKPILVLVSAYIDHAYMTAYDGYNYLVMPISAYYSIDGTKAIVANGKVRVPVNAAGTYTVRAIGYKE